ncbi:MAG: molybdopterin converting factor subunit 1 [Betaproteobacteria bacterium]|nr:molybdopterin converting factor subunit 1 [Betaproteobacteria bacterium]
MVRVLYFARLRELLGRASESIELPPEVSTVGALRTYLMSRGGVWSDAFAEGRAVRIAVNQEMVQPATPIGSDDEVAFFPPVTGG